MPLNLNRRLCNMPQYRLERATDSAPKIVGYAAVFNTNTDLGYCTESIDPGAFAETLRNNDEVVALFNHNPNYPLARTPDTLALSTDTHGLLSKFSAPDTAVGRDITVLLEQKILKQMSFGFYIEDERVDYSKDMPKPHATILRARLVDVSVVTFPQYPETEAEVQRSLGSNEEEARRRLAKVMPSPALARAVKEHRERFISLTRSQFSL